ncbi:hypothetical protein L1049_027386 [Liquidambar formosana]|uniref:F-box domain-containing protein n=1 Tax=Liquidambar formosana TaxID=63359 RepID=A0AAP0RH56_LIQFO
MASRRERSAITTNHQASERTLPLPLDIIAEILSRLPIEDILRCRSVCKTWYGLTKHRHFFNLQLSQTFYQAPRVILIPKSQNSVFLLDAKQNKVREISLENMNRWNLSIMGSCNGLLCMALDIFPNPVVVCNPITKEHMVLPESATDFHFFDHHVGLGYDPWTKNYKAVRVYTGTSEFCQFYVITLGESSWRQLHAPYRVLCGGTEGPVYCEGALYWIIDRVFHIGNEYILTFDLRDEKFRTISFPPNMRMPRYNPDWYDGNLQLLNLAGCITLVQDECRLMHVWRVTGNGDSGFSVLHYTCDMCVRWNVFSRPVLIGMLSQDSFLLEVSKFGMHWERDLVQYFPQRKQYSNLQIHGLPVWFRSSCFKPNLVSPVDASLFGL